MMLVRVVFLILEPLYDFLNDKVLQCESKSMKSGIGLTRHLNPSVAFVGRVATGRNNIS